MTVDLHTLGGANPPHEPPRNFEAEQGVLGAILLNNRAYDNVARILKPEHFHDAAHGTLYQACGKLIERGRIADPVTLMAHASPAYLAELVASAPTVINAPHYAETVRNFAVARQAIAAGHDLIEAAYRIGHDDDISDVAATSLASIEAIGAAAEGGPMAIGEAAVAAIDNALAARETGGRAAGLPTGLTELDRVFGGLARGEVTVAAGCTGMGKTALAGSIALAAARLGEAVAFFSLEMQAHFIANRLLAIVSGVSGDQARRGALDDGDLGRFRAAKHRLDVLPIEIDEASALTVEMIAARARALHRRGQANLVVIDYLGLVRPSDRHERNRVYQIEHVTTELKRLAKSLDIPVLLLTQINRQVEGRDDKRPTLADLRDSGAIEQDAGAVLLIYRNAYYVARNEPANGGVETRADWEAEMTMSRGKAEIIVAKNRHGPANRTVSVAFDGATSGFSDFPRDNQPPPVYGRGDGGGVF